MMFLQSYVKLATVHCCETSSWKMILGGHGNSMKILDEKFGNSVYVINAGCDEKFFTRLITNDDVRSVFDS